MTLHGHDFAEREQPLPATERQSDEFRLQDLLARTSRTFALAIPLLPHPLSHDVTLAYLLFRIADTIEDGEILTTDEKIAAFARYGLFLEAARAGHLPTNLESLLSQQACDNPDYRELLNQVQLVMRFVLELDRAVRETILASVIHSADGMRSYVQQGESSTVRLESLEELRDYCYFVAGLVGEMLTEIFLLREPQLCSAGQSLRQDARFFGEGLQLVNILKDAGEDERAGRCFIPTHVSRSDLFGLARADLRQAERYVATLREAGASAGVIAFADLPLQLAWRTLDGVEQFGAGTKISRKEVRSILERTVAHARLR